MRKLLLLLALVTLPAYAVNLKWAAQNDVITLDPHSQNHATTNAVMQHTYEGLTRYNKQYQAEPSLATGWKQLSDTHWRFYLRKNVKFHDGSPFTVDDVIFSAERAQAEGSQVKSRLPDKFKIEKIDDHTVDFIMPEPNPILHYEWDTWYIFSKPWAEKVGATKPQSATATSLNAWALTANGTGPFRLESHQPGVKTVFKPNPDWWGKVEHNLT